MSRMTPDIEPAASPALPRKKPRLSFLLATCFGVGYLPKAPGTWGSVAGVILLTLIEFAVLTAALKFPHLWLESSWSPLEFVIQACCVIVAAVGVWSSSRVAAYSGG